ncbi:hypothetical protein D3Z36_13135 [Lachnospiraceae bacterium]|nr:hypothetical protein [Lachnospiraceae bacterium]
MKNTGEKEAVKKIGKGAEPEDNKIEKEYELRHRKVLIFFMAACTILESVIAGVLSRQAADRCMALLFLGIFYSILFLTGMELYRGQQDWFYKKTENYLHLALCHGISSTVAVLFLFLPEFARPVLLLSVGMSMETSPFFGMAAGIFHAFIYALCGQGSLYVMILDLLLLLCGCFASTFFYKKEYFRWELLFLFQFAFAGIMIFSYLQTGQLEQNMLIYGLFNGLISSFGAAMINQIYTLPVQKTAPAEHTLDILDIKILQKKERILSEDFELICAMKEFSAADYLHARKVSEISEKCAELLGADPFIAAAGGLYYRIGRMEGEPYVENGVALARSNSLPEEVIAILEEYNGEKKLPSTIESSIVHIVDSVLGKFDVLDKTMLSNSWNQDILVYQTMNEASAAGLYDKSGFSMNMFLKIRDYLIKEAKMF